MMMMMMTVTVTMMMMMIVIINTYKAQYPPIAQSAYNNIVKTIKKIHSKNYYKI